MISISNNLYEDAVRQSAGPHSTHAGLDAKCAECEKRRPGNGQTGVCFLSQVCNWNFPLSYFAAAKAITGQAISTRGDQLPVRDRKSTYRATAVNSSPVIHNGGGCPAGCAPEPSRK